MHLLIAGLCMMATANTCPISKGIEFWGENTFLGLYWARYMTPSDTDTKTTTTLTQVHDECDAVYIMCPSVDTTLMQEARNSEGCLGCEPYYEEARKIPAETYHLDILNGFANKVNAPDKQTSGSTQFADASASFVNIYHSSSINDNYKYFTFKSKSSTGEKFLASRGPQARFGGPDYDFRTFVHKGQLIPLTLDPYMYAWAKFYAHTTKIASEIGPFNSFASRVLVSTSLELCWSLLITGLQSTKTLDNTFGAQPIQKTIPASYPVSIWDNKCGTTSSYSVIKGANACNGLGMGSCQAKCLGSSECVGVYYNTQNLLGGIVVKMPGIVELELENSGKYDTFLQLNRRE